MAKEALPTTKRVEIIDKREFAAAARNADDEIYLVHIAALAEPTTMAIYSSRQAQVAALTKARKPEFPLNIPTFLTSFLQTPQRSYQSTPELMITLSIC